MTDLEKSIYNVMCDFNCDTELDRIEEAHDYAGYGTPESNNRCKCGFQWGYGEGKEYGEHIEKAKEDIVSYWDERKI